MFQDPSFTFDASNLSVNDSQSVSGSFVLNGSRFAAKPGRKRRNKKSTASPTMQMEFIHASHSPATGMEWTREPPNRMSSFMQGGLMTPQTSSNSNPGPFTTGSFEEFDGHQTADVKQWNPNMQYLY